MPRGGERGTTQAADLARKCDVSLPFKGKHLGPSMDKPRVALGIGVQAGRGNADPCRRHWRRYRIDKRMAAANRMGTGTALAGHQANHLARRIDQLDRKIIRHAVVGVQSIDPIAPRGHQRHQIHLRRFWPADFDGKPGIAGRHCACLVAGKPAGAALVVDGHIRKLG